MTEVRQRRLMAVSSDRRGKNGPVSPIAVFSSINGHAQAPVKIETADCQEPAARNSSSDKPGVPASRTPRAAFG